MSNAQDLCFNSRLHSLSSLSSSMESLSSTHSDSYWSVDHHELVPTRSSFTIPRSKVKTSDYDTGFSAAEYDEDEKQSKKVSGRVRKALSFNRTLRPKKTLSVDKESSSEQQQSTELLSRLAMLEEQVRMMGDELNKERQQREELEQKVENLQAENEQLKSERRVAGEQLQKFYKKFFNSMNAIPPHLMRSGLSTSSLNGSTTSMRRSGLSTSTLNGSTTSMKRSGISINSLTSQ